MALAARLLDEGYEVIAYDPKAMPTAQMALPREWSPAASAEDCIRRSALVVVMTPWPEFRAVARDAFSRPEPLTIIDCWRLFAQEEIGTVANVVYLGRGTLAARAALA